MTDKEKRDLGLTAGGAGLLIASKNPTLGITNIYHGTTREAAKGIREKGILSSLANKESGGTKWLSELVSDNMMDYLRDIKNKEQYTHVVVDKKDPTLISFGTDLSSSLYEPSKYNVVPFDDAFIKNYGTAAVNDVIKNTSGHTFVTKYRPHGNFYRHFAKPGEFTNFAKNYGTYLDNVENTISDTPNTRDAFKVFKPILKEYLKAQFTRSHGKTIKGQIPTVLFDKDFTFDPVIDSPETTEAIETLKKEKPYIGKKVETLWKNFQAKKKGDIDAMYFKRIKGPKFYGQVLSNLPKYIATHPIRFGLGAAGTAIGSAMLYNGLKDRVDSYLQK